MSNTTFEEIGRVLREHQQFVVLGHVRPDGDALGSQLALGLSLQKLGKSVRIWNEEGILYADLDPERLYESRQRFDPAGHYHRPDVLRFKLATSRSAD